MPSQERTPRTQTEQDRARIEAADAKSRAQIRDLFTRGGIMTARGIEASLPEGFSEKDLPESMTPEQLELFRNGGIAYVAAFGFYKEDTGHFPSRRYIIQEGTINRLAKKYSPHNLGDPEIALLVGEGSSRQNFLYYADGLGQLQNGFSAIVSKNFRDVDKSILVPALHPRRILKNTLKEIARDEKVVMGELALPVTVSEPTLPMQLPTAPRRVFLGALRRAR